MSQGHERGSLGESIAEKYLRDKGYKIIERRYRIRGGEIDLVAIDKGAVVFVEVKTRTSEEYGAPEEAVGTTKQKRLLRAVARYLAAHKEFEKMNRRIDVVAIDLDTVSRRAQVRHIPCAVESPY